MHRGFLAPYGNLQKRSLCLIYSCLFARASGNISSKCLMNFGLDGLFDSLASILIKFLPRSSRVEVFEPLSVLFSKCNRTFDPLHKSFTGTILVQTFQSCPPDNS